MRLIDSDALLKSHCSALDYLDGEYESCEACLKPPYGCCCLEVKGEDIYYAPTVDAIPIEWLRGKYNSGDAALIYSVMMVLDAWQEEQEER